MQKNYYYYYRQINMLLKNDCNGKLKIEIVMIIIKHLELNKNSGIK